MTLGKKIICIVTLTTTLLISCVDKKACEMYNFNLKTIKESIDKKQNQNLMQVNSAILFFEKITGIVSESNGSYLGRFEPTQHDYDQWLNWFKINYSKLYWDNKEKKVKVKNKL